MYKKNGLLHEDCGSCTRLNLTIITLHAYTERLDIAKITASDDWS